MQRVPVIDVPIYGKQADFRQSTARYRGFCAGRGSGKTHIGALDMILRAEDGQPFMVVSPSYVVMDGTTYPTFVETARNLGVLISASRGNPRKVRWRTQDGGEAEVTFRSGDDPEMLRGPNMAGMWVDEASIQHEDVFTIGGAVLRWKGELGWMSLTFTPRGKLHWTYGVFYDKSGDEIEGSELIRAHTSDNPFLHEHYYRDLAARYTSAFAAQELAGEFIELQGTLFRGENFKTCKEVPVNGMRVRYWDKAATDGDGAHSVGLLMCRVDPGIYYVEDVIRGQWSYLERNKIMLETAHKDAAKYGNTVQIYFEQEPGSGGKESAQLTIREMSGFPVHADKVQGQQMRVKDRQPVPGEAKIIRAEPFAAQVEAGNVYMKQAAWNPGYLEELCAFPEYAFADQVDASSGAFNTMQRNASLWYPGQGEALERDDTKARETFGIQARKRFGRKRGIL